MGQPDLHPTAVEVADQQAGALERVDGGGRGRGEFPCAERFGVGGQLEQGQRRVVESAQARRDQFDDSVGGRQRPAQPPDVHVPGQVAVGQRAKYQLPQEQHVAAAAGGKIDDRSRVDLPTQGRTEQLTDRQVIQPGQLDPDREVVLPQRGQRFRDRLAGTHGKDHGHRVGGHQLLDQPRGGLVEQLGVVDEQHQRAAPALATSARADRRSRSCRVSATGPATSGWPAATARRPRAGCAPRYGWPSPIGSPGRRPRPARGPRGPAGSSRPRPGPTRTTLRRRFPAAPYGGSRVPCPARSVATMHWRSARWGGPWHSPPAIASRRDRT